MGKGKRPRGWQPAHPERERPKVHPPDVPQERQLIVSLPLETYRFLERLATQASASAGQKVSPTQTAEVLLTDALLEAAEAWTQALIEEREYLEKNQLELPFGAQREQEAASKGAA